MKELLKRFGTSYRLKFFVAVTTKVIEVLFNLLTPIVVARMIDEGVARNDVAVVLRLCVVLVALTVVGYLFTLVCQKMAALISQGMGTDIRAALFHTINHVGAAQLDQFGTSSLVTRVTNDVIQVQVAIALGARQLIRWPLLAVGSMVAAVLIDIHLGVFLVVCTLIVGAVFWYVMARSVPYFQQTQHTLDLLSLLTRETLTGTRVIRAFRREEHGKKRFDASAQDQARIAIAVGKLSAVLNPATFLVMNLGTVAILWSGGIEVNAGLVTQGEIVAFMNYMLQTLQSIVYVANLVVVFTRGSACATRILEILDAPTVPAGTVSTASAGSTALVRGTEASHRDPLVELRHVTMRYANTSADALHDITLSLNAGATLGIIGGTGSGKSTLAHLICQLYEASSGDVLVFGRDVKDWPAKELHALVSFVPQHASLISGTLRSNLQWRDEAASDEQLWHALDLAQASDFVRDRPDGLDTLIEAGGRNLSGGQRQRLTIARALVGNPTLVILDDAASALDFATDARLRQTLHALSPHTTSIIISQRVSSVMDADLIAVLDHGRLVGCAPHAELLKTCQLYREICLTQLRPEEVYA